MTTIRKFCCNDLLEITPILMDQYNEHHKSADTRTLSWYMSTIAIWSKYFLVAEAPGNRIMGFNVAKVGGNDLSKCCQIAHVAPYIRYYRSADLVRMFVENIEVTADKIMVYLPLVYSATFVSFLVRDLSRIFHTPETLATINRISGTHDKSGAAEATATRGF
ncbi:hypothetical protein C5167_016154 [Papaver somniferum]|nr:hypothetical protein C5167_016154 [Papaver somniferum]